MEDFYPPFLPHPDPENPSVSVAVSGDPPSNRKRPVVAFIGICMVLIALLLWGTVMVKKGLETSPESRGTGEGVSEKKFKLKGVRGPYPWSNEMLSWQKTGFHFQPKKNWMNDPNGPLLYKGWYHIFYQYNPDGAVWGNIVWGHAVSRDLINWLHLPLAMVPDRWFDVNGVWTGSATLLPDGNLIMLYTGSTNTSVQVQNVAIPADPSDPLLLRWVKKPSNPVLYPPRGIDDRDFRDPTTAWEVPNTNTWRIAIGSKMNATGVALVYETIDFESYELVEGVLHSVAGTGMWECVDFYPVALTSMNGVDTTSLGGGEGVKVVLKASLDDDKRDYYALGRYFNGNNSWVPDDEDIDVGLGLRYDYGMFYASKTFYDADKDRRVLWGWVMETDSEFADVKKGWACVQAIPRTVVLDQKTGSNLVQWPVEEVESLRISSKFFNSLVLQAGTVVPLDVGKAVQLDITAEFELDRNGTELLLGDLEAGYSCSEGGGAARRGVLGPFGLIVLADKSLSEMTPIYFYIAKGDDGNLKTFFCADESRSSKAGDVDKQIYGSSVPVLEGEKLSMRILVDHSIVESFGQGGRTCITSRVYPTKAIKEAARVYLFNNARNTSITCTVKLWEMGSASMHSYSSRIQQL